MPCSALFTTCSRGGGASQGLVCTGDQQPPGRAAAAAAAAQGGQQCAARGRGGAALTRRQVTPLKPTNMVAGVSAPAAITASRPSRLKHMPAGWRQQRRETVRGWGVAGAGRSQVGARCCPGSTQAGRPAAAACPAKRVVRCRRLPPDMCRCRCHPGLPTLADPRAPLQSLVHPSGTPHPLPSANSRPPTPPVPSRHQPAPLPTHPHPYTHRRSRGRSSVRERRCPCASSAQTRYTPRPGWGW